MQPQEYPPVLHRALAMHITLSKHPSTCEYNNSVAVADDGVKVIFYLDDENLLLIDAGENVGTPDDMEALLIEYLALWDALGELDARYFLHLYIPVNEVSKETLKLIEEHGVEIDWSLEVMIPETQPH